MCVHCIERVLEVLKEVKGDDILQALREAKGDKMRAAHLLRISHSSSYNKLWGRKFS